MACRLGPADLSGRVGEWQALLQLARSRSSTPDGALRVEFDPNIDLKDLADLIAAEQRCCPFAFTVTVDVRGVGLEVRAPEDAAGLVDDLFGPRP